MKSILFSNGQIFSQFKIKLKINNINILTYNKTDNG